jgi:hypothetical protein
MRERSQYIVMMNAGEEGQRRACKELRDIAEGGEVPYWALDLLREYCSEPRFAPRSTSEYFLVREITDPRLVDLLLRDSLVPLTASDVQIITRLLENGHASSAEDLVVRRALVAALRSIDGRICLVFDRDFQETFRTLWKEIFPK